MLVYVFDSNLKKVDVLKKCTFIQYEVKTRDIGRITINAEIVEENKYLLNDKEQYYFVVDGKHFYRMTKCERDSDGEFSESYVIEGVHSLAILSQRVIDGTVNISTLSANAIYLLIRNYFTLADDKRKIYIAITVDSNALDHCTKIEEQITGGYVWDKVKEYLDVDNLSIEMYPIMEVDNVGVLSITGFTAMVYYGTDRRSGNSSNNVPVVFSQQLSNVSNTTYINDDESYKNNAYVAGEGEGSQRKWYNIDINTDVDLGIKTGIGRHELWIDARDIQSDVDEDTTLTDEQYENEIKERAKEKGLENNRKTSYSATVVQDNKYIYEKDYKNGDFVTVKDDELGLVFDVQVTSVIHSTTDYSDDVIDIELTYGVQYDDPIEKIKQIVGNQETIKNNVKYLDDLIGKDYVSDFVKKMYLLMHPVGSIVIETTGVNPQTVYGGSWVSWGSGKVPVGVDASDTDFGESEKTGGEKTHTLEKKEVPNAKGNITFHGAGSGGTAVQGTSGICSNGTSVNGYSYQKQTGAWSVGRVDFNLGFGGGAHNNLQPYITCFMWKRIS